MKEVILEYGSLIMILDRPGKPRIQFPRHEKWSALVFRYFTAGAQGSTDSRMIGAIHIDMEEKRNETIIGTHVHQPNTSNFRRRPQHLDTSDPQLNQEEQLNIASQPTTMRNASSIESVIVSRW